MINLITDHIDVWTSAQTQKTNGVGRGNGSANHSSHGIKKLRELILELAVHGELVPQDPSDEPASVLLERIISEKRRLTEEEGLRTTAKNDINTEEEYLGRPNGWAYCRLGNLAKFIDYRGGTPNKLEAGIPLITAKNVRFGYISREPKEYISENEYQEWMTRGFPKANDVLFTTEAPLGNVALINIEEKFALAQRVICFQLHESSIAYFVRILIMSPAFQNQLADKATGMTATGIKAAKLKEIAVPLPPPSEQRRIVAKVDELMALCDQLEQQQTDSNATHQTLVEILVAGLTSAANQNEFVEAWQRIANQFETLFTSEQSIDQLKQTILQLAVMGKLVPQDPKDEPASVLLKKIAGEKERLVKEGKIKKEKPLPEIREDEKPFQLPQGWAFTRLGNISNRIGSGSTPRGGKSTYEKVGIPFLRSQNVWNHGLELTDVVYISDKTHQKMSNTVVIPNDILLNITGASLGRCTVYPDELGEANVSQHVTIIRPTDSKTKHYLHLCILSPYTQTLIWGRQVGMAREGLSKKVLELFEVPLPPYAEQNRIVAKVDELMTICDTLKARINDTQTTQVQLADAIVDRALT